MAPSDPTTVEAMQANFPKKGKPAPLEGRPNMKGLISVLSYMRDCSKSHRVPGRDMGLLHLVLPPPLYANYTAAPYPPRTPDPGPLPLFPPNATDAQRRTLELQHALARKLHIDEETMDQCLTEEFLSLLSDEVAQDIRDQMSTLANPTFLQVYVTIAHRKYGGSNPTMNLKNKESMTADWTADEGVTKLFRRIERAAEFAQFAGAPVTDREKMDAALVCINRTGQYRQDYIDWKSEPNQTWVRLKEYFEDADRIRVEVDQEAGAMGYGMAGTEGTAADEQKAWDNAMANFGRGHAANQATMQSMAEANSQLTQNIGAALPQLQGQLHSLQQQLCMLANQAPTKPPPPQQYGQQGYGQYQGGRRGGRGGRRGGQYGQQGGNMGGQWNQPPANTMNGYPQQQQMGQRQSNPQNPIKRYENWWYCHTHGCDVDHQSNNCPRPRAGHQFMATRNNRMGGSNKQHHKTTLPSQVGRQGLRTRDMNHGQGQQQQQYPPQQAMMPQQQMAYGATMQQPAQPMMPLQPL